MNLLTSGVMEGLIGASSNSKIAGVSMSVYHSEAVKLHPDMDRMNRSAKYSSHSIEEADKDTQKAAKELEKAQLQAKEEEKAKREAEAKKQEKDNEAAKTVQTKKGTEDSVVISDAGKAAAKAAKTGEVTGSTDSSTGDAGTETAAVSTATVTAPVAAPTTAADLPQAYSSSGDVKVVPETTGQKLSVVA